MSNNVSLEDVPFNRFHRLLSLRSSGGSFVDGYVLSIIGIAMPFLVPALAIDSLWESLIAVSALIGIFLGGFVGGSLTDRFGRRVMYFIGPVLFTLCSLLQLWVDSGPGLFALRLLIGIGIGFEYPVATAFLVEFLPRKSRGPRLAGLSIYFFAGAAAAYIVGQALIEAGGADGWRYALASTALVSGVLLLLRMGTPESPRWLISKGFTERAERVIKQVYGNGFGLKNLPEPPKPAKLSVRSLLHAGYGKRMFFVTTFWTCSVIPVFAVYAFAPKVLEALHLDAQWSSYGSMIITMMFVVGCLVATWLVNAMGRRSLLIHSLLWSGLALLLLGTFSEQSSWLIILLFAAYAFLIGGAQVLQFIYPNEIFPTEIRAVAVGFGTSVSRIGAVVGTYLVPVSIQTIGIGHTLYCAAGITFIGLVVSWLLAPETRGIELCRASSLAVDAEPARQPSASALRRAT
ncbi:MFS transporter [Pseudomonas sp. NPDC089401]|uniref:MFS transporter n=1 Tax=Pseudomonas sp. NPDC089401 TaxID=3364462 RepID=UPI00380FA588